MGHPQEATPVQVDNSTASGIVNDTIKQQRSRAMDMRYHWTRDRVRQKQFDVYWKPGKLNKGDCFTKHHAPKHHQIVRSQYLHCPNGANACLAALRGCVNHTATSLGSQAHSAPARPPTAFAPDQRFSRQRTQKQWHQEQRSTFTRLRINLACSSISSL
jgi:hypothetical protein